MLFRSFRKMEEDAAWKKEPAYGKTIRIGYNGGLCLGTFGIAQMKGFYEAEGLKTEITRYQGGSSAQGDAIGTGKIDVAGDHIATLLIPAVNGVRMKFTSGLKKMRAIEGRRVSGDIWSNKGYL